MLPNLPTLNSNYNDGISLFLQNQFLNLLHMSLELGLFIVILIYRDFVSLDGESIQLL